MSHFQHCEKLCGVSEELCGVSEKLCGVSEELCPVSVTVAVMYCSNIQYSAETLRRYSGYSIIDRSQKKDIII